MQISKLVLLSLILFLAVFSQDITISKVEAVPSGANLTAHTSNWRAQVDAIGSKVSFGSALVSKGLVEASFTMVKQSSVNEWPYVELMCGLGRAMSPQDTVTIEYRSDSHILLKLVQSDLGDAGNETYAYYEYELPATGKKFKSATVVVSAFSQPAWAPEEAMFVPLRPENVAEIQISPLLDEKTGGVATIAIQKLVVTDGPKE